MKEKRKRKHSETLQHGQEAAGLTQGKNTTEAVAAGGCICCSPSEDGLPDAALQHGHEAAGLTQGKNTTEAAAAPEGICCSPSEDELPGAGITHSPEGGPCVGAPEMTEPGNIEKIYFRRVWIKRGVTVRWDGAEVLEPATKKTKAVECIFPQVPRKRSEMFLISKDQNVLFMRRPSYVSTPKHLTERESSLGGKAPQGREQAGTAGEPPAQAEGSRAKTPEGLGGLDSGLRCLGCCRVFRSLEALQGHVENALRDGFSCQAFNRAFARMHSKYERRARALGGGKSQ